MLGNNVIEKYSARQQFKFKIIITNIYIYISNTGSVSGGYYLMILI